MRAPPPLLAAEVAHRLGDAAGEEAALKAVLAREVRHLGALLAMGELKLRAGDERAAASWFRSALHTAAQAPPPPGMGLALERAAAMLKRSADAFERHLLGALGETARLPRLHHAVDLLTGKVPLYLQRPSMFYFPGLPQRAFYERHEFPWLAEVEALTAPMQAELAARLAVGDDFRPYIEAGGDRPSSTNALRDDSRWGAHYFWRDGEVVASHAAAAPATMAALALAPMPAIANRSPMALWSRLEPGTHIEPHHGMLNTRLICHVPLLTNPDCALRVGPETRSWQIGQSLIFDDSFEHEAWNRGRETRVVLLFEIWRPEIGAAEREALVRLFEIIDLYGPDGAEPDAAG
jgi:aspartyl/asparaginyl beta-hydroxylase (cupin superfamily)